MLGQFWMLSLPISLLRIWRNEHGSALPQIQHHHLEHLPYISFPLQFLLLFWIKTSLLLLAGAYAIYWPTAAKRNGVKISCKALWKTKHFKASHPETKHYPGIFQVGSKSLNFFELAAVPWHRLDLTWRQHGWPENTRNGKKKKEAGKKKKKRGRKNVPLKCRTFPASTQGTQKSF